jgi:2-polyprenyl-6-hydroxyphenyl methylase/3-demethylubiquinone-9 3-methyltransferase
MRNAAMGAEELKAVESHFEFGANWQSFAREIDAEKEDGSLDGLGKLTGGRLDGLTFLDIGCGSGLSALSAIRLGISRLHAIDIDADSVNTTRSVLASRAAGVPATIEVASVFDLRPENGTFDVVHSWGVLHHTGSMWEAIDRATALVSDGGVFLLAIYLKTPFCGFWRREKRMYTASPRAIRSVLDWIYTVLVALRQALRGRNPFTFMRTYAPRGMSWMHDARDWLGGYPYESASSEEIIAYVGRRGFALERAINTDPGIGVFGSHCGEWAFRKL